jgi:hypothetical protein
MPLTPSWKMHVLQGLVPLNKIGDQNVTKFSEAMTHNAAVETKMKYLSEDHNLILIADNKKQVIILHNLKNYGGATLQPTNKVAALFEIGPGTQVIVLDVNATISTQSKCTQSAADIITAATIGTDSRCALQAPTGGDVNYNGLSMFTPAPFLQNAILETMTHCPFKIIQAAIAAHTLYVHEHKNDDGFSARGIEAHRNLLIMWCLAVGQESIPETQFSFLLDGNKPKKHKANTHHEHIQPTLQAAAAAQINPAKTVQVLWQLGGSMVHSCKAPEAQTATQQEHLAYQKEKDKKKKDKAEKWHGLSWRLVLNAASTNGVTISTHGYL